MRRALLGLLLLAACQPSEPSRLSEPPPVTAEAVVAAPSPAGLVALPCAEQGPLRAVNVGYCRAQRHFMTPTALAALKDAAQALAAKHPGAVVRYMEASWPSGKRPMPPHLSHGDGRQIDLAIFYQDREGRPLDRPPTASGYGAFEPPRRESERVCFGVRSEHARPDPPASRAWRLDETRTAELTRLLAADRRVRRVFIEPHLKSRFGLGRNGKVRFAGCGAARHDDHLHVDFA